jgi:hypothetical protein
MPPKTLFRVGLGLLFLAAAVYFYSGYWLKTRIFVPLNVSVSLDTRQIQSPPFRINLRESYYVSLPLDDSHDDWYYDGRCNYRNALGSKWRVYRLSATPGQPREFWASSGPYYSDLFAASPGRYELELDLPVSASCLNSRHPHLKIQTWPDDYQQGIACVQIFCIFLGATSVFLTLLGVARSVRPGPRFGAAPRMFPGMVLRNVLPIKKHVPPPLIHGMPHWGLFCSAVLWILIFIFMVFQPEPFMGLFVTWETHDAVMWGTNPGADTFQVYVAVTGGRPRFLVNGQEVDRMALRTKLLEQLSRRAEWSVYFEADPDTLYMDDIYVIDTIQACGAKVIWITPKMREEWQRKLKGKK